MEKRIRNCKDLRNCKTILHKAFEAEKNDQNHQISKLVVGVPTCGRLLPTIGCWACTFGCFKNLIFYETYKMSQNEYEPAEKV